MPFDEIDNLGESAERRTAWCTVAAMPRRSARCAALRLTIQSQLAFASFTSPALSPLLRS
jgi:hypothetical protein